MDISFLAGEWAQERSREKCSPQQSQLFRAPAVTPSAASVSQTTAVLSRLISFFRRKRTGRKFLFWSISLLIAEDLLFHSPDWGTLTVPTPPAQEPQHRK